jgi:hypothetical protein
MPIRPEDLIALDMEASGLHPGSYPIQFGWCTLSLVPGSFYLRRPEAWTDRDWSWDSEVVHGISRPDLQKVGIGMDEAVDRLASALTGKTIVSDNPHYERQWLERFHAEAGLGPIPEIVHLHAVVDAMARAFGIDPWIAREMPKAVRAVYPHTHSADDDALSLAAALKTLADPVFGAPFIDSLRNEEAASTFAPSG